MKGQGRVIRVEVLTEVLTEVIPEVRALTSGI